MSYPLILQSNTWNDTGVSPDHPNFFPGATIVRSEALLLPRGANPGRLVEWMDHQALALSVEACELDGSTDPAGIGLCLFDDDTRCIAALARHSLADTRLDHLEAHHADAQHIVSAIAGLIAGDTSHVEAGWDHDCARSGNARELDFQQHPAWTRNANGAWQPHEAQKPLAICSGSFFPLHAGHRGMTDAVQTIWERPVRFELAVQNADKPALDFLSIESRASQFSAGQLIVTSAPRFDQKAELFPESAFVVGWDTAQRILDRRFYDAGQLESALDAVAERNCRFAVASRRVQNAIRTLNDLDIPPRHRDLFSELSGFLEDVSSTELRENYWRGTSDVGPVPIL